MEYIILIGFYVLYLISVLLILVPYLYWVIVVALSCYILILIFKILTISEYRVRRSLKLTLPLVPFIYLTWPFLIGRIIFEIQCSSGTGLYMPQTINASGDGYFLYNNAKNASTFVPSHPYAHQATWDLISGRISFFETSGKKIFLANNKSRDCTDYLFHESLLNGLKLPDGKCVAETQSHSIESKYEVRGYERGDLEDVKVIDRFTGNKVAGYRRVSLAINRPASIRDMARTRKEFCPAGEPSKLSPIRAITATVFSDSEGKVLSASEFGELKDLVKADSIQEFPPRQGSEEQQRPVTAQCTYPKLDIDAEIRKVKLYQGGRQLDIRLDNSSEKVSEVNVVLNNPNKKTILHLSSFKPVVWRVSRTPGSILAGVFVSSYHGTAVLGIDRETPLAIKTLLHNPATNCETTGFKQTFKSIGVTDDFQKIFPSVRVTDSKEVNITETETIVIGESDYQKNLLIYSEERSIYDFRVY